MKKKAKKTIGAGLVASPFVGIAAYAISQGQGKEVAIAFAASALIFITLAGGVILLHSDE